MNEKEVKHQDQLEQIQKKHRGSMLESKWQLDQAAQKCQQLEEKLAFYKKKVDPDSADTNGIDATKLKEFQAKQNSHRIRALLLEMEK